MKMQHEFAVTGNFDVEGKFKPVPNGDGTISGFQLPDGRTVRLILGLEVEDKNGKIRYVTSERQMERLGFSELYYDNLHFHPGEPIVNLDEVLDFDS